MIAKMFAAARTNLEPKGRPHDTLENLDWIPQDWAASKINPEALRGLGSPLLMVGKACEGRWKLSEWPVA